MTVSDKPEPYPFNPISYSDSARNYKWVIPATPEQRETQIKLKHDRIKKAINEKMEDLLRPSELTPKPPSLQEARRMAITVLKASSVDESGLYVTHPSYNFKLDEESIEVFQELFDLDQVKIGEKWITLADLETYVTVGWHLIKEELTERTRIINQRKRGIETCIAQKPNEKELEVLNKTLADINKYEKEVNRITLECQSILRLTITEQAAVINKILKKELPRKFMEKLDTNASEADKKAAVASPVSPNIVPWDKKVALTNLRKKIGTNIKVPQRREWYSVPAHEMEKIIEEFEQESMPSTKAEGDKKKDKSKNLASSSQNAGAAGGAATNAPSGSTVNPDTLRQAQKAWEKYLTSENEPPTT